MKRSASRSTAAWTGSEKTTVVLASTLDWSSVVPPEQRGGTPYSNPVFRHLRFSDHPGIPFSEPTIIGVVDDVLSTHRYEIEVKATKVP